LSRDLSAHFNDIWKFVFLFTAIFDPLSYSKEIFENIAQGSSVLTVSATDADSGNSSIEFISMKKTNFRLSPIPHEYLYMKQLINIITIFM